MRTAAAAVIAALIVSPAIIAAGLALRHVAEVIGR